MLRDNRIHDNWRRGVMLFQVPDAIACAPVGPQQTCTPTDHPTQPNSHRNRFHDNVMGISPDGERLPNGVDFWWAEQVGDKNNCWYDNVGSDGTEGGVTSDPRRHSASCAPGPLDGVNLGTGSAPKLAELTTCFLATESGELDDACPRFTTPR